MSNFRPLDSGAPLDYRAVFDALPNPCALLSPDLKVLDVNAAYPVVVGRTRRELLGRDLIDVLPFDALESFDGAAQRIRESLQRALATGHPEVLPVQRHDVRTDAAPHAPAATRYWISTATPILNAGSAVALLHKIQDVTPVVLSVAADFGAPGASGAPGAPGEPMVDLEEHTDLFGLALELQTANEQLQEAQERERETSLTLQRSMLPASIPEQARGRVAARYLPARSSLSVGGDWYDVAALPDGRLAAAVGDVVGQGLHAAAVMGQLRSALSAVTIADVGPGNALRVLDRFARQTEQATATTAVKVVLDLDQHTVTYSSAGHLPPLLQHADGRIEALDQALGPPLATTAEADPRPQATVHFAPGARLVLYTDGLIERRTESLTDGIARLVDCLNAHPSLSPEALIDTIIAEVRDHHLAADDTAVLVIRL
ncbi:serine phosphatase RsbU (regulator of sigma subunit) [Phycicoccus badiiscoriae]|uniref:Serine phosphatase RsbU (Regulator of sigma subunit) n=1 Tax=Pedococcus badiiscoriae TaxID=642776 RepID=A0A852WK94_9MICO|nr:SpoIIE family protein phosphatase [Pedococcus badiiscoriae]NYG07114.1 serine phosphatase RsbU (regulator of sigma subunit) [Pedococcus badiiscoriae]